MPDWIPLYHISRSVFWHISWLLIGRSGVAFVLIICVEALNILFFDVCSSLSASVDPQRSETLLKPPSVCWIIQPCFKTIWIKTLITNRILELIKRMTAYWSLRGWFMEILTYERPRIRRYKCFKEHISMNGSRPISFALFSLVQRLKM